MSEENFPSEEKENELKTQYVSYHEREEQEMTVFVQRFLPDLEDTDAQAVHEHLQGLTAREVWHLRKSLGPEGLQRWLEKQGLYDLVLTHREIRDLAETAVTEHPITGNLEEDTEILTKLVLHESINGKIYAVSPTGALGLGQMIARNYLRWNFNPFNPREGIFHAALYLHNEYEYFHDLEKTIVAYNRGRGGVLEAVRNGGSNWKNAIRSSEGRNYLGKVLATEVKAD